MPDLAAIDVASLLAFIAAGFAAQLIDGALGMAFGVISTSILLGLGVPPAAASAGVHTVETFTTGASGISHAIHKNVDWRLFARIAVPGTIGGALGAYVLSNIHADAARPAVLAYLALIGLFLLWRGLRPYPPQHKPPKVVEPLGLAGGFLDAAGGGGWGPVVTGNLLVQGTEPRRTIGTVNSAEFFVTATISATFITQLGWAAFTTATVGLLIGGIAAAPLGAIFAKKARPKILLVLVGVLLTLTSLYGVYRALSA
ncbi:sulfite exporter TauE/SafE family protein [Sphingosinicella sp. LHD-64]|uniref:sulfite exporter TauE/SafE family protein n=1 Tax=Sphingosinicella sp. LHD-64 TaxID=3072139 RepID=UPI00280D27E5|nr:sulfite exporter TauE/SafE family protein [Sphingosinicella sp. LHD-64]MDQ8757143.1 sulfite exporter TauE/SafE family protein [Sphingosinicella sp. LHD-64]